MKDALALLERLRPADDFDPDSPAARAALERILAQDRPTAPPPRRPRRLAAVGAAAVAALAVVLISPLLRGSPDVVARAAAALNDPGTILHLKAEVRFRDTRAELRMSQPDGRVDRSMELWQTAGARQERMLVDDELEWVEDWDTKTSLAYNADRNEIIRYTEPDIFDPAHRVPRSSASGFGSLSLTDDLAVLLDRARRGDAEVKLAGETNVRGVPVYALRIEHDIRAMLRPFGGESRDAGGGTRQAVRVVRTIYVDRERFLPVRIVEEGPGGVINVVEDYVVAERLPRNARTEGLLKMSPHPGAEEVVEGRL